MSAIQQNIFSALPGLEVPVADVQTALSRMWESPPGTGGQEPEEFRASQMNLILHLGRRASVQEAHDLFMGVLRFARRYPCRIILLCPEEKGRQDTLMTLKVFAECYIGKTRRDRSCCEALILAYPGGSKDFLENQVSILLENDLPTYYWFHRFSTARNAGRYHSFLKTCKRVVYDSGLETDDVSAIEWPHPGRVRDLVYARLLPVRQSIGQFLSTFEPASLCRDLESIEVRHVPEFSAEARVLGQWFRERLADCAARAEEQAPPPPPDTSAEPGASDHPFELRADYSDGRRFHWKADLAAGGGVVEARLERSDMTLPFSVRLLSLEVELAEAFFF